MKRKTVGRKTSFVIVQQRKIEKALKLKQEAYEKARAIGVKGFINCEKCGEVKREKEECDSCKYKIKNQIADKQNSKTLTLVDIAHKKQINKRTAELFKMLGLARTE